MFRKSLFTIDGVLSDIAGASADLDALVLRSVLQHSPAKWMSLFSPANWVALQWSSAFYSSRLWMRVALDPQPFEPG